MTPFPPSFSSWHAHSIFVPSPNTSADEDKWEVVEGPYGLSAPVKKQKMVTRDKDIIVAHGSDIRVASLTGDEWQVIDGSIGTYRTLISPQLDFEVQSLVVNTTGKLLAVVGRNQVAVVVLPSNGSLGSSKGSLPVKAFPVDDFQFTASSTVTISKVLWHPWGQAGNSLWILTSDGKLREYDVLNPDDPTQTFFFLPETISSRAAAMDPSAFYATSFSFSPALTSTSPTDWSAAMVHVMCANGDIYVMGPILPLHSVVPVTWLQCLRVHADRSGGEQKRWVDSVWNIVRGEEERKREGGTTLTTASQSPSRAGRSVEVEQGMVRIHPPHLTPSGGPAPGDKPPLQRQGPMRYDPPPQEVGEAELDEDVASDILISEAGEQGETVVAIAWSGGKVDLCLIVDPPQPRWVNSREKAAPEVSLTVIESVLLPLASDNAEAIAANAPVLVVDPMHKDTVYVQHAFGVDAISVQPWILALDDEGELPTSDVTRIVSTSSATSIVGSFILCNITFGYGLIALASTYQLVAVELDFRVTQGASGDRPGVSDDSTATIVDPSSLLSAKPLKHQQLVDSVHAGETNYAALARKASTAPVNALSGDLLRQVGDIVNKIQTRIHAIRQASKAIENHLDLCAKEFSRQIRLVKQCRDGVDGLQDVKAPARIARMLDRQTDLAERLERVVAAISAEYGPEIGEAEKRWFDELDKLKLTVMGSSIQAGLAQRAQVAREQLRALAQPKAGQSVPAPTSSSGSEHTTEREQIQPLQYALKQRGEEIKRLTSKVEGLSIQLKRDRSARRKTTSNLDTPKGYRIGLSNLSEDEAPMEEKLEPARNRNEDEDEDEGNAEAYL